MNNMDHMKRLAVFGEVGAVGSFSEAGRRLGMTRSAVSQHVSRLEEALGVRLLTRSTRSVALTQAGSALFPHCRALVASADAAVQEAEVQRGEAHGELVVSAPKGLATHIIAPVLPRLLADNPHLQVTLRVEERVVDLVAESVDVAARAGHLQDSSLTARKIAPLELLLCAAPSYFETRPRPTRPEELHTHDWLSYLPIGDAVQLGNSRLSLTPRARFGDGEVLRRMLVSGAGIGLLPRFYIDTDLDEGQLEVVMPDHSVPAGGIWLVHAYERRTPPKVRAFINAVATQGS